MQKTNQIQAVIFDLDGTIACSEHLWRRAMIGTFGKVNLILNEANCIETIGMKIDQVVEHWYERRPWEGHSTQELTQEISRNVTDLIRVEGTLRDGIKNALEYIFQTKKPMAIASSSALSIIETTVESQEISHFFKHLKSAEFEKHGKPNPAVYLSAAKALQVDPRNCLAFEDSLNGIRAAKAAGMTCVAVKEEATDFSEAKKIADFSLETFEDFHRAEFLEELGLEIIN